MASSDVLVLGGPAAGKTHYAGQLLGRLRNDRQGSLRLRPGGADDLGKFEEVLACLEEGRAAGHTPAETWTGMKCQLETRTGEEILLEWPEYAGERLASIVDNREMTSEWKTSISAARAWLLFIRLSTLNLYEDLLTRPSGIPPKHAETPKQRVEGEGWDDRARYVEVLQMLLFITGRSTFQPLIFPRLAVVLSCWDEINETHSPDLIFKERLPLLQAFIQSTWAEGSWSVWGLSSLGRALNQDTRDDEYARKGPENFGYVIHPQATDPDPDLTAPIAWLLGASLDE